MRNRHFLKPLAHSDAVVPPALEIILLGTSVIKHITKVANVVPDLENANCTLLELSLDGGVDLKSSSTLVFLQARGFRGHDI